MIAQRTMGVGLGLALLSAATFSTSGSFARSLIDAGWTPGAAVAVRIGIGALLLAAPAAIAMRGKWGAFRRGLKTITLYGLLAVAGAQVFFFNAIQYLPVGVALLIEYLGIVFVVGWLWLRHGNRPRRLTIIGSVTALGGLALILDLIGGGGGLSLVGVLWALAAAAGLAAYFVLSAKQGDGVPGVTLASAGMGIGAVALFVLGGLGWMPMRATFGEVDFAGLRTEWWVPVIGLSLVAAAVAYVAGISAARVLGAKLASFVGLTEVVFAVLVAWALLGELPTGLQFAGGMLIVAGVAIVRYDEISAAAIEESPAAEVPETVTAA